MPFMVPQFEIDKAEPFKKDLFEREDFAKNLESFLIGSEQPLVIALDGQWGSGKSVFLKMWEQRLRNEEFKVVYYDAFENDFQDDAFLSIAGQILSELKDPNIEKQEKFIEKTVAVSKALAGGAAKAALKYATFGIVDDKAIEKTIDSLTASADKIIEEQLKNQAAKKAISQEFKEMLKSMATKDKPLIIIIDELDRCRPKFALEVLERMKHFFSTTNVHFILGVNLEQLSAAIKHEHGETLNASLYLEKFINFKTCLPFKNNNSYDNYIAKYFNFLISNSKITDLHVEFGPYLQNNARLFSNFNLSYRNFENLISLIKIHLENKNFDQIINYSNQFFIDREMLQGTHKDSSFSILMGIFILKVVDQSSLTQLNNLQFDKFNSLFKLSPFFENKENHFYTTWHDLLNRDLRKEPLIGFGRSNGKFPLEQEALNKLFILTPI